MDICIGITIHYMGYGIITTNIDNRYSYYKYR